MPARYARSSYGTARRSARGERARSTGRRAVAGGNARESRWTASTAERALHLGQHIREEVVPACELVGHPTSGFERSARERLDQPLGVITVQGEATLRIVDDGAGPDAELPTRGR